MQHGWDFKHMEGDILTPAPYGEQVLIYNPINGMHMSDGIYSSIEKEFDFFEGCYEKWRRKDSVKPGSVQHMVHVKPNMSIVNAYVFNMCPGCISDMKDIEKSIESIRKLWKNHIVLRLPYRLGYFQNMTSKDWLAVMTLFKLYLQDISNIRVEVWYHKPGMQPHEMLNPELYPEERLRIIRETSLK